MAVKRIGRVVRLQPEYVQEYMEYHRNIWAEVRESIKSAGIANYSIFYKGGLLFSYYEIDEADMGKLPDAFQNAACDDWESIMGRMQRSLDGKSGETWTQMDEVFHLD